jgi:hypothetical protein
MFGLAALFITEATVLEGYVLGTAVALVALYAIWQFVKNES